MAAKIPISFTKTVTRPKFEEKKHFAKKYFYKISIKVGEHENIYLPKKIT